MTQSAVSELRLALRRFRKRPARGLLGVLMLGLGIGTSTAAYSGVQAVLLEPLPIEAEDDVVIAWQRSQARDFDHVPFSPAGFEVARMMDGPVLGVAAVETVGARAGLGEGPDGTFAVNHVRVAGDFFGVLGVEPTVGRMLAARDDELGATPTVVISHRYWVQTYGADPDALRTTLRYNDVGYAIVGVAPAGFDYPRGTDVWATLRGSYPDWDTNAPLGVELDLVVRLEEGLDLTTAFSVVDRVFSEDPLRRGGIEDLTTTGARFTDLVVGTLRPVLQTTLAAALILLLVAVANATLLFLSGGATVLREGAIRQALGASRRQVAAPFLADATLQAGMGFVLGIVMARLALSTIVPLAPEGFARLDGVVLDVSAVAFASLLGVASLVGSAGLAVLWLLRRAPQELLASGGLGGSHGGQGLRKLIAAGQMALAVVAAVGAALLWQSVRNLGALDRGFESEGLHIVTLSLPFSFFEPPEGFFPALESMSHELGLRPDIVGVSTTMNAPLSVRGGIDFAPRIDGQSPEEATDNPYVGFDVVLPRYFEISGTEILEGRAFGPSDGAGDDPTIIVNRAAAELLWPETSSLGGQLFMGGLSRNEWRTVVGVVEDHRFRSFPDVRPAAYVPLAQYDRLAPTRLLVRSVDDGAPIRRIVQGAVAESLSGVHVLTVESMTDVMARPMVAPRFASTVLVTFAAVTLLLAALGVHGVFTVLVQERRRDLGIRKALGAASSDVARFVGQQVVVVGLVGAGVGGALSIWASGLIESLFFGVSPGDLPTVTAVTAGAVLVGVAAGVLPAASATRTDAAESLRTD